MKKIVFLFVLVLFYAACEEDAVVVPTISIGNATAEEGNNGNTTFTFTISLSEATSVEVSMDYATGDGTAVAGDDYQMAGGRATIPAGATETNIEITVFGDTDGELDETFDVVISNATNGTINRSTGTGTIQNDDAVDPGLDGYITPDNYPGMTLVWQDEFDGNSLTIYLML